MEMLNKRRVGTLALGLVMSFGVVACGGDAAPTATAVPTAAPTKAAAPTNTTAAAGPTATAAMAVEPTATAMAAEPTATTASGSGSTGSMSGPSGEIEAAAKGMKDVKTYHMDITTDAGGMDTNMTADVDTTTKNLRVTTSAGGQNIEVIVIGSDAWVSMDGGKTFTKDASNGAMAQGIQPFLTMWDTSPMSSGTPAPEGAIKAGTPATETLDGAETHHWIIDSAAMGGGSGGAAGTVEMWVTVGDQPTIRQMKTSSTAAGATTSVTIKWSKINEDLKIEAPATP